MPVPVVASKVGLPGTPWTSSSSRTDSPHGSRTSSGHEGVSNVGPLLFPCLALFWSPWVSGPDPVPDLELDPSVSLAPSVVLRGGRASEIRRSRTSRINTDVGPRPDPPTIRVGAGTTTSDQDRYTLNSQVPSRDRDPDPFISPVCRSTPPTSRPQFPSHPRPPLTDVRTSRGPTPAPRDVSRGRGGTLTHPSTVTGNTTVSSPPLPATLRRWFL